MAKSIAVVTGASSGIGKRFAERIIESGFTFDEIWVIARRADRLNALELPYPTVPVSVDLTDPAGIDTYKAKLEEEKPEVKLLINASGFGKFAHSMDVELNDSLNMIDLNCRAVVAMCQITVPFMPKGSKIINIASVASNQPIPYINIYAASKAFVLYYSRALNQELKSWGIHVMAVCPFWTKTEFFNRAIDDNKEAVVKKYIAMYEPDQIVGKAYKDLGKGKDVSEYGFKANGQTLLTKILPHSLVMKVWMNQQGLK